MEPFAYAFENYGSLSSDDFIPEMQVIYLDGEESIDSNEVPISPIKPAEANCGNYIMGRNRRAIQVEHVTEDFIQETEASSDTTALALEEQPSSTGEQIEDLPAKFIRQASGSHMKKYFKRRIKVEKAPPTADSEKPKRRRIRRKKPPTTYVTKKERLSRFSDEAISPSYVIDYIIGCRS